MISLCTTYDAHDPILLEGVMPFVDFLEVTPDTISMVLNDKKVIRPDILDDIKTASESMKIIAHGVGLSIGSCNGYDLAYLELLDQLLDHVPLEWHSEHLGYVHVNGCNLNTMLTLPRTREVVDMLIPRIRHIQEKYKMPFLLENIAALVPDYMPEYTPAEFLNIIVSETGCGLLLDTYNIECDAYNFEFDIKKFICELELPSVREIHIAGGLIHDKGFKMDIHSRPVAQSTIDLTLDVLARNNGVEIVTYEVLPEAVKSYGHSMVIEEVSRLAEYFKK